MEINTDALKLIAVGLEKNTYRRKRKNNSRKIKKK